MLSGQLVDLGLLLKRGRNGSGREESHTEAYPHFGEPAVQTFKMPFLSREPGSGLGACLCVISFSRQSCALGGTSQVRRLIRD